MEPDIARILRGEEVARLSKMIRDEAPTMAKVEHVLQSAVAGDIEILFESPSGAQKAVLWPWNGTLRLGVVKWNFEPDYLVFLKTGCEQLSDKQSAIVSFSEVGYREHQGDLIPLQPGNTDRAEKWIETIVGHGEPPVPRHGGASWVKWAIASGGMESPYRVSLEDVFVRVNEFRRWRQEVLWKILGLNRKIDYFKNSILSEPIKGVIYHKNINFTRLEAASAAALHFWTGHKVHLGDKKTHPKRGDVVKWLHDNYPGVFSGKGSAEEAYRLSTPDLSK